jgi:hypothetical protein
MGKLTSVQRAYRSAAHRVYADLLMPNRLRSFDHLLQVAKDCGYEMYSVLSFWLLIDSGRYDPDKKYVILRHDVDTDVQTARRLWEIENRRGVHSSFYFRLSTWAPSLMKDIHASGSEASYHYEEVATVVKQKGLTTIAEVRRELPRIREMFKHNLFRLREQTNLPMLSVASHGDFANRKLGVQNTIILDDGAFRRETGIKVEAYDDALTSRISSRHSDKAYPVFWVPDDPITAFRMGDSVVQILVHPRQWCASALINLADDLGRLWEGTRYKLLTCNRFHSTRTFISNQ